MDSIKNKFKETSLKKISNCIHDMVGSKFSAVPLEIPINNCWSQTKKNKSLMGNE